MSEFWNMSTSWIHFQIKKDHQKQELLSSKSDTKKICIHLLCNQLHPIFLIEIKNWIVFIVSLQNNISDNKIKKYFEARKLKREITFNWNDDVAHLI